MTPLKRSVINLILYFVAYIIVAVFVTHSFDLKTLLILAVIYFALNYVLYSVLDKVSKT